MAETPLLGLGLLEKPDPVGAPGTTFQGTYSHSCTSWLPLHRFHTRNLNRKNRRMARLSEIIKPALVASATKIYKSDAPSWAECRSAGTYATALVVSNRGQLGMPDDDINSGGNAPPPPSGPSPEPPGEAAPADPTQAAEHSMGDKPLSLWERIKHMVGR
jgi:hypothetical protein